MSEVHERLSVSVSVSVSGIGLGTDCDSVRSLGAVESDRTGAGVCGGKRRRR
jgi:hypothetical protein